MSTEARIGVAGATGAVGNVTLRLLAERGYRNVRRYSGGLLDWEDAGLPLEGAFATAG